MSNFDQDDQIRRSPPQQPYQANSAILYVPKSALEQTVRVLQAAVRVETCCFWYGRDLPGGCGRVEAVVVPPQRGTWGNYDVTGDAMAAVSAATRAKRWVALAQVHSHPGDWVEHSRYDDARAISRGVLSVVFPRYGHWTGPWPHRAGIHEFQINYWHLLSIADAARRLVLEGAGTVSFLDLR
ncbi:hypothetical protein XI09_09675 [Bradyrhizobium sp. CCBAU 11386]|uniref:Mov34/MPN/PAD-1 family protein n=1 Tax=Bradyrhizobium sp. CCBAU 11386 TaxID=1630837 RepID=UPI00230453D4|nr:Mov34/MPN/PAD-1 family protein [Bradyrhizobium sp. CCBAU 11386]MDA9504962.1 hypothetical protein [Bradyrhizobium sp. CCBAU 11386]